MDLHGCLRENIKTAGLIDVYRIVACGLEDVAGLEEYGVVLGSIDTIQSVQILCSVPDASTACALLKPGGQLIVHEPVKSKDVISSVIQSECRPSGTMAPIRKSTPDVADIYNTFWSFSIGNRPLNRRTQHSNMQAGDWSLRVRHRKMHGRCLLEYTAGSGRRDGDRESRLVCTDLR